ncbi:sugar ABC transporter ATP-binding protein [Rhizobium sp. VS19-DR104.2]|uniref:sugar ABC transporter ATP-binding protein n=1 Tax=unclassified Rhizobium TaxID=2613769 RepID=UPI001CC7133D|nr:MULTISPECIES: sugar ABC transporter ATP-binding protein [unclassified Rhizobium]MBZ5763150.1 sugar ABC transporter ATP-binding protein [Rhizobium sp. VS19-DR96]MBZ5769066.1 sugar ABC transporter ATP-binding protein [Rhizobium sp. VS19-DR129.2]MBZ5776645.1 sugar ABC transporter ATP-binding protein [Rhizobium sp. VS19-DRK62.2]MBZ5787769.1 sugar ABC transporter ATP-binding protein [Rhizobium sp. VS19-DR121]MBZ5805143.1 sugar ABC transporter ATP-binding protein [Rhizobium sp. VS19-DR181]
MNDLATSSSAQAATEALIAVRDIRKSYGAVHALGGVDFQLRSGEVVGLVGHNGAGKSTLMNVLSGAVQRTAGSFRYGGEDVEIWSAGRAQSGGLRCIFQELSLCANLSAAENTRIVHRQLRGFGWRGRARDLIARSLDEIFPGHGIDPNVKISELSIGLRQMVEIARAFTETDIPVRCAILDEPTSSLGHQATEQLLAYIRKAASKGVACILITHRLNEIISVCNRAVVMVDGKVIAERATRGLSRSNLVEMMGSLEATHEHRQNQSSRGFGEPQIDHAGIDAADRPIQAAAGEVIGFAGLDGHGQRERLRAIFAAIERSGKIRAAYVAGDRGLEGIFGLWSIADNLTIRSLNGLQKYGFVSSAGAKDLAGRWSARLKVKAPSIDTPILSLSGGNQQKVLFARALASDASVIFLDDPMRGVDVGTKQEVYQLIRSEAERGRTFVWYTTEMEELNNCDRLYVFREGRAVEEIHGADIDHGRILEASFGGANG